MTGRSWLFVPGDSPSKLSKIPGLGADVVVLDLEDAVAAERKAEARALVAAALQNRAGSDPALWVRINPLDSGLAEADLDAVVGAQPDGIVLPKADGVDDVRRLDSILSKVEADREPGSGHLRILAIATETASGVANLAGYADHPDRLWGLTWGAEDLADALGAGANRDAQGHLRFMYRMVRAQLRLAAAAAGLPAIDTLYPDFRDEAGLAATAAAARGDGFAGMLAIHPAQVPIINEAFTPTEREVEHAEKIVAAFAAEPGTGVTALDGVMLDRPHLEQARRVLRLARSDD
ncbi:MAG: HpcH/HpaI aldolase/citrate lyase family protein [Gammaproteobacteria bacterium]